MIVERCFHVINATTQLLIILPDWLVCNRTRQSERGHIWLGQIRWPHTEDHGRILRWKPVVLTRSTCVLRCVLASLHGHWSPPHKEAGQHVTDNLPFATVTEAGTFQSSERWRRRWNMEASSDLPWDSSRRRNSTAAHRAVASIFLLGCAGMQSVWCPALVDYSNPTACHGFI